MKKLNLVGQKFNRLTVICAADPIGKNKRAAWVCECDCENKTRKVVAGEKLVGGTTKSCGCWNQEARSLRAEKLYSARRKYTPEEASARRVWKSLYSDMPFDDFYELSQKNCYFCNKKPENSQNSSSYDKNAARLTIQNADFIFNGLDRVDNTLGHSKENCVSCCRHCNRAKRNRTLEDFESWIICLHENMTKTEQLDK